MAWDWDKIEFKNEKRFLSNMEPCKIVFEGSNSLKERFNMVEFDGEEYDSTEHLYQALKSTDKEYHKIVRVAEEPRLAKKAGRKNITKDPSKVSKDVFLMREDWDEIKVDVMKLCVYLKFTQNEDLAEKLKVIEGDIVERNCWHDYFWGTVDGKGENNLGKILMTMRGFLLSK
jgi:ribA/ribD-fused uncharacterized protein